MNENNGSLVASIQQKLEADTEFQDSLVDLSEEDKQKAIQEKTSELIDAEFNNVYTESGKNKELAENYKVRAEKAEGILKNNKPKAGEGESPKPNTSEENKDLSSKDLIALMTAKVPEEDVDDVVEYAKFKGISVAEALKTDVVKTTLASKAETRKTAQATHTGAGSRGTYKVSDETLLNKASKGEMPESDEDIARLAEIQIKKNRQ